MSNSLLFCLVVIFVRCSHDLDDSISLRDIFFLKNHLTNSSQIIHEPSSWPANRRYFFLVRVFAQMGILRCEHFLPEKKCFVGRKKINGLKQQILISEKILVQLTPPTNENISAQKKRKYTYFYKSHNSIRNLKNIMISSEEIKPPELLAFDYLTNDETKVNRIIAFIELFHYFYKRCKLRPRMIAFVEGDLALDYLIKKRYDFMNRASFQKKMSSTFENSGYLLIQQNRVIMNSFFEKEPLNNLTRLTKQKKSFFCRP